HQLRIVVASRKIPKISLSRLVVQQDVVGISARHLRFTPEEVAEFVRTGYGLRLTGPAAQALTATVNGWIAGVVLSLRSRSAAPELPLANPAALDEAEEQLFEYLAGQVLAEEEPAVRDFLLGSAVLDAMTPDTCDRLLGREGSAGILARVEASGLFVERLEAAEPTYLYHDLFRRFLLDQLQREAPARHRALQRAAGDLHHAAGAWERAVDHYLLAGHVELAADVL